MNSEEILIELRRIISNFEQQLNSGGLREKVLSLLPSYNLLCSLGKSLIPSSDTTKSAMDRILYYFQRYPGIIISGKELMVVGGIQETTRRVRQLRVEYGWYIINGTTAKAMAKEDELPLNEIDVSTMKNSDYIMISVEQDREAAFRWNVANGIRREDISVQDKILKFLKENVGKKITGEELKYLAKNRSEWARRTRELRTDFGWPVVTRYTGRPDFEVGVYMLEEDRQSPVHDRRIPDPIRGQVLRRDQYKCTSCQWTREIWHPDDPRHLELHHVRQYAEGGENTVDNLITLCTVCHDEVHRN